MSEKGISAEYGDPTKIVPLPLRKSRRTASWRRLAAAEQSYESACRNVLRLDAADAHPRAGRARLESQLSDAVHDRDLTMNYQPQFDMRSGLGIGVEALARWTRPNGEHVPPSVFIAIAERSGLIAELGEWAVQSACEEVALWTDPGERLSTLSVNVSTHQVDAAFCAALERIIERTGFAARRLELEITESALFADPKLALECLSRWKNLGVCIALDDFGTGYCSLSYLSRLPVDRVKLDKSFTQTMVSDRKSAVIVRAVIDLCREMGITVLAEGVETEPQFALLNAYGCGQAQGYLMASPAAANEARALLGKQWGRRPGVAPPSTFVEGVRYAS